MKYYAVKKGRTVGIFMTWSDCQKQIMGFSGAVYKSFTDMEQAKSYLENTSARTDAAPADMVAYVDGSFDVKTKRYSYGVVILFENEEKKFCKAFSDNDLATMRNVAGELAGAMFAMEFAVKCKVKTLDIFFDYEGIEKWCTGDWKTNKQGTKDYAEYYKTIKDILSVRFVKVAAHTGDKYNEMADLLAKSALFE